MPEFEIISQSRDPRRAALYARVSTADQKTGLEAQIRALKEFCERMNVGPYELFTDENFSGAKISRPSLDRMMAAVRNNEISTVIVYSFSRFARSTSHLLAALEEMRIFSTEFISITEKIETNSPMGRAFFTVIAAIAQLERELIVERVRCGLKNAKAKGKHIGRVKTRPSELIRALRASGLSLRETARVARSSHGSVGLEMKCWAQEAKLQGKTLKELMEEYNARRSGANKKGAASGTCQESPSQPSSDTHSLLTNGNELSLPPVIPFIELDLAK